MNKPDLKLVKEPGRNDPCPCKSGKKYKVCCLAKVPRISDRQRQEMIAAKVKEVTLDVDKQISLVNKGNLVPCMVIAIVDGNKACWSSNTPTVDFANAMRSIADLIEQQHHNEQIRQQVKDNDNDNDKKIIT